MKRTALLIMSFVMCAALCLTGCKKEESETTESGATATLSDFVGTYDVTITESLIGLGEETHNATLTIEEASVEALGIEFHKSNRVARFTYTTEDAELSNKGYFPYLSSSNTYGYVEDGYMVVVCTSPTIFEYTTRLAYKAKGTPATISALYVTAGQTIDIKATRR